MPREASQIQHDFDRIARLSGEHAEANRYEDRLLRHVPRPCARALDLGCGAGTLTHALAGPAEHVLGVDLSPEMIRLARQRCADRPNAEFVAGDFLSLDLSPATFDCITAVAVLHHMPLVPALERAKGMLRPGGVLLVLDLFRDAGPLDWMRSAVALVVDRVTRPHRPRSRELHAAWSAHAAGDLYLSVPEARALFGRVLPGCTFRRHLLWRYSVVWTKPGGVASQAPPVGASPATRVQG